MDDLEKFVCLQEVHLLEANASWDQVFKGAIECVLVSVQFTLTMRLFSGTNGSRNNGRIVRL